VYTNTPEIDFGKWLYIITD